MIDFGFAQCRTWKLMNLRRGGEGRTRGEEWRAHGEVGTHCVGRGQMSG